MTPNERKIRLLRVYWGLEKLHAKCIELGLSDTATALKRHAEKVGAIAATVRVRKMSVRWAQGTAAGDG